MTVRVELSAPQDAKNEVDVHVTFTPREGLPADGCVVIYFPDHSFTLVDGKIDVYVTTGIQEDFILEATVDTDSKSVVVLLRDADDEGVVPVMISPNTEVSLRLAGKQSESSSGGISHQKDQSETQIEFRIRTQVPAHTEEGWEPLEFGKATATVKTDEGT